MHEKHWHLRRSPFGADRSVDLFFAGQSHHDALLKLRYLIDHRRGAGVLVGACGSGKSQLLDVLLQGNNPEAVPVV